jgi:AcrR family transcriptional regulator
MNPKDRKAELFEHAMALAVASGYMRVTRSAIAEAGGVTEGLVTHYFGTMTTLRRDIMRAAVKRRVLPIVAQGMAMGEKAALKAPEDLRKEAASWSMTR